MPSIMKYLNIIKKLIPISRRSIITKTGQDVGQKQSRVSRLGRIIHHTFSPSRTHRKPTEETLKSRIPPPTSTGTNPRFTMAPMSVTDPEYHAQPSSYDIAGDHRSIRFLEDLGRATYALSTSLLLSICDPVEDSSSLSSDESLPPQLAELHLYSFEHHNFLEDIQDHHFSGEDNMGQYSALDPNCPSTVDSTTNGAIGSLPVELLLEIFLFFVSGEEFELFGGLSTKWVRTESFKANRVLREVCSLWFRIVTQTPMLWGSIQEVVESHPSVPDNVARLELQHARRATLAFDTVDYRILDVTSPTEETIAGMDIMSRTLLSCSGARIQIPEHPLGGPQWPPSRYLGEPLPQIRNFSWESAARFDTVIPSVFQLPWSHLWVSSTSINTRGAGFFPLPWAQLTSVSLWCPLSVQDCCNVLLSCPVLESVAFGGVEEVDNTFIPPHMRVSIQSISTLTISATTPLYDLFNAVELPSLSAVDLQLCLGGDRGPLHMLNIEWQQLETIILTCDMDLENAYQLFRCCHAAQKLQWIWPQFEEVPLSRVMSTQTQLELRHGLDLTVDVPGMFVAPLLNLMIATIRNAHTLRLSNFPAGAIRNPIDNPFIYLTVVNVTEATTIDNCLRIMKSSSKLTHARFVLRDKRDILSPQTNVVESTLLSLKIQSNCLQNVIALSNCLTLPNLLSLELNCNEILKHGLLCELLCKSALRDAPLQSLLFNHSDLTRKFNLMRPTLFPMI